MKIRWHGMLGTNHSWAFTQQALARAMVESGQHEVFLKSTNGLKHFPQDLESQLLPGYHCHPSQPYEPHFLDQHGRIAVVKRPKDGGPLEIPDQGRPYDLELAYTIFMQAPRRFFSETPCKMVIWNVEHNSIPDGWHLYHRAVDFFLPSSQYCRDIFVSEGVPKEKCIVVPHGVDTEIFNPNIKPFPLITKKKFKFLHNAIPHARKLHDRVLEAYFEAFTKDDDVCLVLKTKLKAPDRDKPFEVDIREILEKASHRRKNLPEIEIVQTFVPNMASLHASCDAIVSTSASEGFCLLPQTRIDTLDGPKASEHVVVGDRVVGSDGNISYVTGTTFRHVDEDIIEIRRKWHFLPSSVTGSHPMLAVRANGRQTVQIRKKLLRGQIIAKWIPAAELKTGDLIVVPKPQIPLENDIQFDVGAVVPEAIEEDGVVSFPGRYDTRGKVTVADIASAVGCATKTVRSVLSGRYGRSTFLAKKIQKKAQALGWFNPTPRTMAAKIEASKDFMEFAGIYLSKGYSNKTSVIITYNKKEQMCLRKACSYIEDVFDFKPQITYTGEVARLSIHSKVFSLFIGRLFGHTAREKRIPSELWGSHCIKDLIRRLFYGDDSLHSGKRNYSITTSSEKLAHGISTLLLSWGIMSSVSSERYSHYILTICQAHNDRFEQKICPTKYNYNTCSQKTNHRKPLEGKQHFLVPIVKITQRRYHGIVRNLHVQHTSSFTSNGMCAHNCLPLLEALACEKIVIAPRYGGQLDFLDDSNSMLINTGEMPAGSSMQYWAHRKDAVVGDPNTRHCAELMRKAFKLTKEEREKMLESGRKTVKEFTWERASKMITDLAEDTITHKRVLSPKKRKVMYIVPYPFVGGGEVWIREAIQRLDRSVWDVSIVCPSGAGKPMLELFSDLDVRIDDLKEQGHGHALKVLIESENPDILHFYNSLQVYKLILQTIKERGWHGRVVETVHSELMWNDSMSKIAARKDVSMIISVSNTLAKRLVQRGNKNVVILPQQVDWEKFHIPRNRNVLNELGIPDDAFVVGTVARLSPEKNIQAVVECAKALPDFWFVVIGGGPQESILRMTSKNLQNIVFAGQRTDVEKFYAGFDALLISSKIEGLPLVALEAMSAGVPVVAPAIGAIPEILRTGKNGVLVKNSSVQALIDGIIQLRLLPWENLSSKARVLAGRMEEMGRSTDINRLYNLLFR